MYVLAKSQFDRDDAPDRDDMRAVASLLGVGCSTLEGWQESVNVRQATRLLTGRIVGTEESASSSGEAWPAAGSTAAHGKQAQPHSWVPS